MNKRLNFFAIVFFAVVTVNAQNFGIGTETPTAKTHIVQENNENALRVDDEANDGTPFIIDENGAVGIGITTPTEKLDINGNIKSSGNFYVNDINAVNINASGKIIAVDSIKTESNISASTINTSGSVGIGTQNTNTAAALEINSTTQGFLMPRLTSAQRDALVSPVAGLQIFNINRKCIEFYTGMEWTSATPVGTIKIFIGTSTDVPDGWYLCDGSEIDRTNYADLFTLIQVKFGVGDGYSTFTLPDFRGSFLRGVDNGAGNDPDVASRTANAMGEKDDVGSVQGDENKSHYHSVDPPSTNTNTTGSHAHTFDGNTSEGESGSGKITSGGLGSGGQSINGTHINASGNHYHSLNIAAFNSANSGGAETRPKNIYVNYIIKY